MNATDNNYKRYFLTTASGLCRGGCAFLLTHPLNVIKTLQQTAPQNVKATKVALTLFKEEGFLSFYKGGVPHLIKMSMKQIWLWPLVMEMPRFLERQHPFFKENPLCTQAFTGFTISTVDTLTQPFEKSKFLMITNKTTTLRQNLNRSAWNGFGAHFRKNVTAWSAFLSSQHYIKNKYIEKTGRTTLTLGDLTLVGVGVSTAVGLMTAPFDIANTLKQSQNITLRHYLSHSEKRGVIHLFAKTTRGAPLNILSLAVHNITSVILLDRLGPLFK